MIVNSSWRLRGEQFGYGNWCFGRIVELDGLSGSSEVSRYCVRWILRLFGGRLVENCRSSRLPGKLSKRHLLSPLDRRVGLLGVAVQKEIADR